MEGNSEIIEKFESKIPSYDKLKKLNITVIKPKDPKRTRSQQKQQYPEQKLKIIDEKEHYKIYLNHTIYDKKVREILMDLYKKYSDTFNDICTKILNKKYKEIYHNIFYFVNMLHNDPGRNIAENKISCLVLNTDQNNQEFFNNLVNFLRVKNRKYPILDESFKFITLKGYCHFKDLNKLFDELEINTEHCEIQNEEEDIEIKKTRKTRILTIGQLNLVSKVEFNLFLQRMFLYSQLKNRKFNYLLIFDVGYDPKILFEKVNVGLLSKIYFYSIENINSNDLYQEILYEFFFSKKNIYYIPDSTSINYVLKSILLHQISIETFKHYLDFMLFQFFLLKKWKNDEFLIFCPELAEIDSKQTDPKNKEEKLLEFFKIKIDAIYGNVPEHKTTTLDKLKKHTREAPKNLLKYYQDTMKNKQNFITFYKLFENFLAKININEQNSKHFLTHHFLHKFMKYDSVLSYESQESIMRVRARIVVGYFELWPSKEYGPALRNEFIPMLVDVIKKISSDLDPEENKILSKLNVEIEKVCEKLENPEQTEEQVKHELFNFQTWLETLLSFKCFKSLNQFYEFKNVYCIVNGNDFDVVYATMYLDYIEYAQIIEPQMNEFLLSNLETQLGRVSAEEKKKFGYYYCGDLLLLYIKCYKNLGVFFKLSHFFMDFFNEVKEAFKNSKDKVGDDKLKEFWDIFLFFSYFFSICGLFQKKKGKFGYFTKTFYGISKFDKNSKEE